MEEVDALAVDFRRGRFERVEACLLRAPVERVLPVGEQRLEVSELGAHLPADAGELIRKARPREALAEVVENGLGDVDGRGRELECHARKVACAR